MKKVSTFNHSGIWK